MRVCVIVAVAIARALQMVADGTKLSGLLMHIFYATIAAAVGCQRGPLCLNPNQACLDVVLRSQQRYDCPQWRMMCNRSVYETPAGVRITLPAPTDSELRAFYASGMQSRGTVKPPKQGSKLHIDGRALTHATMILTSVLEESTIAGSHFTAVEIGCGLGYTLFHLARKLSLHFASVSLHCFESDPDKIPEINRVFNLARSPNVSMFLHPETNYEVLEQGIGPHRADLVISSQVIEHWSNPFKFFKVVLQFLKPGGLLFTDYPDQFQHPEQGLAGSRGILHLLFFNQSGLANMANSCSTGALQEKKRFPGGSMLHQRRKHESLESRAPL